MKSSIRIMGIDPGSLCTGFGVVDEIKGKLQLVEYGIVRSQPKSAFPTRLEAIYDGLVSTIETHQPEAIAVEDIFFAVNAKSTIKLGQTRGVALLAGVKAGLPVFEYTPLEVKQTVVSYGRADKQQVQDMVTALLGLKEKPQPFDASDALAVAICHIHSHTARERLKRAGA